MKATLSLTVKINKNKQPQVLKNKGVIGPVEVVLPNHSSVTVGYGECAAGGAWFITSAGGVDRLFALRDDGLLQEFSID
jgi:hypothetical protein